MLCSNLSHVLNSSLLFNLTVSYTCTRGLVSVSCSCSIPSRIVIIVVESLEALWNKSVSLKTAFKIFFIAPHWCNSLFPFVFSSSEYNLIIVPGVRGHSWVPSGLFTNKMEGRGCRCLKWTSLCIVPKYVKSFKLDMLTCPFKYSKCKMQCVNNRHCDI